MDDQTSAPRVDALDQLGAAVAQVMAEMVPVRKTGKNTFHGYVYASDDDLLASLQPAMGAAGLSLLPMTQTVSTVEGPPTGKGKPQWRTDLVAGYLLLHSSGQSVVVRSVGCGLDGEDKGVYKAMTGARKYALRTIFSVPTGDDAERDDCRPSRAEERVERPSPALLAALHECRRLEEQAVARDDMRGRGPSIRAAAGAPPRGTISEAWGKDVLVLYAEALHVALGKSGTAAAQVGASEGADDAPDYAAQVAALAGRVRVDTQQSETGDAGASPSSVAGSGDPAPVGGATPTPSAVVPAQQERAVSSVEPTAPRETSSSANEKAAGVSSSQGAVLPRDGGGSGEPEPAKRTRRANRSKVIARVEDLERTLGSETAGDLREVLGIPDKANLADLDYEILWGYGVALGKERDRRAAAQPPQDEPLPPEAGSSAPQGSDASASPTEPPAPTSKVALLADILECESCMRDDAVCDERTDAGIGPEDAALRSADPQRLQSYLAQLRSRGGAQ